MGRVAGKVILRRGTGAWSRRERDSSPIAVGLTEGAICKNIELFPYRKLLTQMEMFYFLALPRQKTASHQGEHK